jgi:hypothetical protein
MKLLRQLLEMSKIESSSLKSLIEHMFKSMVKLDVSMGMHIRNERLVDREQDVTLQEVLGVFKKARDKYGLTLFNIPPSQQSNVWILKDPASQLNIVIKISFKPNQNKYFLEGITIMRKDPRKFGLNDKGGTKLYV